MLFFISLISLVVHLTVWLVRPEVDEYAKLKNAEAEDMHCERERAWARAWAQDLIKEHERYATEVQVERKETRKALEAIASFGEPVGSAIARKALDKK